MKRIWQLFALGVSLTVAAAFSLQAFADSKDFIKALKRQDFDTLSSMIEHMSDVDIRLEDGRTALMIASKYGENEITLDLLRAGADVNARNFNGGTPLMYAAIRADMATVRLLLEYGAQVNTTAKFGWTALMVAAAKGHTEMIENLLVYGADANTRDVYQWTPLMRASYAGYANAVESLLKHSFTDVNAQDENGATALHHAASNRHYEVVRVLLEYDALIGTHDKFGLTALDRAVAADDSNIIALLVSR